MIRAIRAIVAAAVGVGSIAMLAEALAGCPAVVARRDPFDWWGQTIYWSGGE